MGMKLKMEMGNVTSTTTSTSSPTLASFCYDSIPIAPGSYYSVLLLILILTSEFSWFATVYYSNIT